MRSHISVTSGRPPPRRAAALAPAARLPARNAAGLVHARLHELLAHVLEHHRNPSRRDRLGDLTAHRPRADDGCL